MNTILLIAGGIILFGFLIFIVITFKARKKHKAIKHYEELRDKLSVREAEEETGITEEEYNAIGDFSLGNLIGGFIAILIGVMLLPIITDEVQIASGECVTEAACTMLSLIPIFFALAIVMMAILNFLPLIKFVGFNNPLRSAGLV